MKDNKTTETTKLYKTVYDNMLYRIRNGEFKVGEKIPTTKALAASYGVSVVTMEHALKLLKDMNILYSIKKSGTYVNGIRSSCFHKVIAFILPNSSADSLEIFDQAEILALRNNCFLEKMDSKNSLEREKHYVETVLKGGYDGVIIYACDNKKNLTVFSKLKISGIPTVFLDSKVDYLDATLVTSDNLKGMRLLMGHLMSCGHSKIAFSCVRQDAPYTERSRFKGYCRALVEHGVALREEYLYRVKRNQNFSQWFEAIDDKPTAIVCINDMEAKAAIKSLTSAGYSVPEDVSIVGFDDSRANRVLHLTTIRQNFGEIGRLAVEEMQSLWDGGEERTIFSDVSLCIGKTVKTLI